jgi:dihydroorotate dehydrogenase (fumarate)
MSIDLSTTYLGLRLAHPVVASAGPLTGRVETLQALEAAGAAAVVLPSLFEEDAEREMSFAFVASGLTSLAHAESSATGHPALASLDVAQRHVVLVADAKAVLRVPVIASINGSTPAGWIRHASQLADAGADALELNVYRVVADPHETAQEVEDSILELVEAVRATVRIPLAVKIGPYYTALPAFVRRIVGAGADGIVLFNRFYQPDIDLEELEVRPSLDLSTSADLRLPLRWAALLSRHVDADIALSGGIHRPDDVIKAILVGAGVAMTTSSLLRHGASHLTVLRDGLATWLHERDYLSVSQMRGSMSVGNVPEPDAYERANYLKVIQKASRAHGLVIDTPMLRDA